MRSNKSPSTAYLQSRGYLYDVYTQLILHVVVGRSVYLINCSIMYNTLHLKRTYRVAHEAVKPCSVVGQHNVHIFDGHPVLHDQLGGVVLLLVMLPPRLLPGSAHYTYKVQLRVLWPPHPPYTSTRFIAKQLANLISNAIITLS